MIKFLDKSTLWPTIYRLSSKAEKSSVAVAYLGKGSANRLKLKKDDRLVTCMSLQSLQTGQTDPYEVEKFMERGVKVYTKNALHAKVYVFNDRVITCSANLSISSEKGLIEAGVLTDEKTVVNASKKFVRDNCEQEIDEPYLIWAKKHYNPSRGFFIQKPLYQKDDVRYWLMSTEDDALPQDALDELIKDDPKYMAKIANKRKFIIDYVQVSSRGSIARGAKEGDRIIELYYSKGSLKVHAPKMVLSNTTLYSHDKPVVRIAEPIVENSFRWQSFKAHLTKHHIYSIGKITEREIRGKTLSVIKSFFAQ